MMRLISINPATGIEIARYPEWSQEECAQVIEQCDTAFLNWKPIPLARRRELLLNLSLLLMKEKTLLAEMMTREMGKTTAESIAEVEKCVSLCDYYVENAERILSSKIINTRFSKSKVVYQPLGIIYAIMPWNFPLWQVLRFAVPNITAGNVGILKHAPNCMGIALMIEQLFRNAGYPDFVFKTLMIDIDQSPAVIAHPKVRGVTITGSEGAGRAVAVDAGRSQKKVVLELGGNDPYIVLEDADLEKAADVIVNARLLNAGQVCISPKRIILVDKIYETMRDLILEKARQFDLKSPLARKDLRARVHQQVENLVKEGAALLMGGKMPEGPGYFYPVTALENIPVDSGMYDEEIFGPVISLYRVEDEAAAIELANKTRFGLGAAVFTSDIARGEFLATHLIHAGSCAVNTAVASDPRLPFGGTYHSGFGRELSDEGMREFMNIKTVSIL